MSDRPDAAQRPVTTGSVVWGAVGGLAFLATGVLMYLPAGLVAPAYGVVVLWAAWLLLAVGAVMLLRARRPGRLVLVAIASALVWFAVVLIGDAVLGWTA